MIGKFAMMSQHHQLNGLRPNSICVLSKASLKLKIRSSKLMWVINKVQSPSLVRAYRQWNNTPHIIIKEYIDIFVWSYEDVQFRSMHTPNIRLILNQTPNQLNNINTSLDQRCKRQ